MAIIGISGKKRSGKDLIGKIIQYLITTQNIDNVASFESCLKANSNFLENEDWKIVKFVDKLKDMVCLLIGCSREQLEDETFKNTELGEEWDKYIQYDKSEDTWNTCRKDTYDRLHIKYPNSIKLIKMTPRFILQNVGTDLFRNQFHLNTWVNATMADYKTLGFSDTGKADVLTFPNWIITDCRFPNEAKAVSDRNGINIRVNRPSKESTDIHESETSLDSYDKFDYIIENNESIQDLIVKVKKILILEGVIQ